MLNPWAPPPMPNFDQRDRNTFVDPMFHSIPPLPRKKRDWPAKTQSFVWTPSTTLTEAYNWYWDAVRTVEGAICPITKIRGKINPVGLNRSLLCCLANIYRSALNGDDPEGWVCVTQSKDDKGLKYTNGTYCKLKYWKLIEQRQDGNRNYWRITEAGLKFLMGRMLLPRRMWIIHNRVYDAEVDKLVDVKTAWKAEFNLREIVKSGFDKDRNPATV